MGKRGNGEGTITKRKDGRWEARVSLPDGQRKPYYGKTRADVSKKLAIGLKSLSDGTPILSERATLGTYLTEWLSITSATLKESSANRYELAIRKHIKPAIGKVPLAQLSPQHVHQLHAALREKGLGAATIDHVHSVLRAALSDAERWGRVQHNVTRLVSPPRIVRREMLTLSPEESHTLIDAAADSPVGPLFVLMISTGMRVGEALALSWPSVDLDHGTLSVIATLSRAKHGYRITEPKTVSGRRQILLPAAAVNALRTQRATQNAQRLLVGRAWQTGDFVFSDALGQHLNPDGTVRREWKSLLTRAEISDRRLHDLRHRAATLLVSRGIHAKIVSEQLGHSSIKITLDRYSHVTPTMQRQAADAMDAVLSG